MKKYSEIALSDEEKKVLDWLKSQDYTHIGRSSNNGFIEVFDNQKGFRVNLKPMRKPFEFVESSERYEIDKLLNPPKEENNGLDMEDDMEYWFVVTDGNVSRDLWACYSPVDNGRLLQGNVFLTEEEAKFESKRREVFAKVKKYARPFTPNKKNFSPFWAHIQKCIFMTYELTTQEAHLYFESEEKIHQAIAEVGEENFKKYYLGVTE